MKVITSLLQKIHSSQIIHGSSSSNNTLEAIITNLQSQINTINSTLSNNLYKTGISPAGNNLNNALSDGCWYWNDTTANRPCPYGTCFTTVSYGLTHNNTDNWVNQLAFGTDAHIYFRQKINAGTWTSWVLVK